MDLSTGNAVYGLITAGTMGTAVKNALFTVGHSRHGEDGDREHISHIHMHIRMTAEIGNRQGR
jgi:hypothetical protein